MKEEETKMAIKRICDACGAAYDVSRCVKRGKRYYCPICQEKPKAGGQKDWVLPDVPCQCQPDH